MNFITLCFAAVCSSFFILEAQEERYSFCKKISRTDLAWLRFNHYVLAPVLKKISPEIYDPALYPDASPDIQREMQKAQNLVGIPLCYQLPVKQFVAQEKSTLGTIAQVLPTMIRVNQQKMQKGEQNILFSRYVCFHEVTHVRCADAAKLMCRTYETAVLNVTGGLITPLLCGHHAYKSAELFVENQRSSLAFKAYRYALVVGYVAQLARGYWLLHNNDKRLAQACEKRADMVAYEAIGCSWCIEYLCKHRGPVTIVGIQQHAERGYITKEEGMFLAQKLRKEQYRLGLLADRTCKEHASDRDEWEELCSDMTEE